MPSGSSALSITDIPFIYSLSNIVFIWIFGIQDINRFLILGLIAGIFGTFLVYWHPVQFIYDKIMMFRYNKNLSSYLIKNPKHEPKEYDIIIEKSLIRLSLKTTSIKYLKDKMVSQDYFIIILIVLAFAVLDTSFQEHAGLKENPFLVPMFFAIMSMLGGMIYLSQKQFKDLMFNLKLNSLYFLLTHNLIGFGDTSNIIKNAIDLNDWTTVREMIDRQLHNKWTALRNFSKRTSG